MGYGWGRALTSGLRILEASARSAEREQKKRQKEYERQQKYLRKLEESNNAAKEVKEYESTIHSLKTIHESCNKEWNWQQIRYASPPTKPEISNKNEKIARKQLEEFKPNLFCKLFNKVESTKNKFDREIENGKKKDEEEFNFALKDFELQFSSWKKNQECSVKILEGNLNTYTKVLKAVNPLGRLKILGKSFNITPRNKSLVEVEFCSNCKKILPFQIKSLLKSGKPTIKKMSKIQYYKLSQDYLCSCILRVARELFALLPIEIVIITVLDSLLNTQTEHVEQQPIISVAIPLKTLESLNFSMLDPSDSLKNFIHNMNLKKNSGFEVVEKVDYEKIKTG